MVAVKALSLFVRFSSVLKGVPGFHRRREERGLTLSPSQQEKAAPRAAFHGGEGTVEPERWRTT